MKKKDSKGARLIEMTADDDMLPEYDIDYSKAKPNRFAGQTISTATKRDQALRELSAFLDRVHARMPEVEEAEGEKVVAEAVRKIRRVRTSRKGQKHK